MTVFFAEARTAACHDGGYKSANRCRSPLTPMQIARRPPLKEEGAWDDRDRAVRAAVATIALARARRPSSGRYLAPPVAIDLVS